MPRDDVQRRVALLEELRISVYLLQGGLRGVQEIGPANDSYLIPFILLTSGLERLIKVVVCYDVMNREDRFPTRNDVRPFGHDLERLIEWVAHHPWPDEYLKRPAATDDISYLKHDSRLKEIVHALQLFADARVGRYHNLEVVFGNDPGDAPEQAWANLEMDVVKEEAGWAVRAADSEWLDEAYARIGEELVRCLERMVRAIVRLFTLDALGAEAKKATGLIQEFLFLLDEDLGRRGY